MYLKYCYLFVLFIYLTICLNLSASAQILNIEKSRIRKDSSEYFLSNVSFNFRAYNRTAARNDPIRFLSINANADIAYFSPRNSYMLLNFVDYLSISGDPFTSFGYSHARINFLRNKKVSYVLYAQGQYDLLRGLDERYLGGGGFRFDLIEKPKLTIDLGVGLMYEHEQWEDPNEDSRKVKTDFVKSSNYVILRYALKPFIDFNMVTYYQVGRDNLFKRFRHRINTDANFNVKISNLISFRTSFSCAFDNAPIVDITRFIYSVSNGIQFNISRP